MSIKNTLALGFAIAASLGSTAHATNLVLNGGLENPGDTSSPNFFCNSPGSCGNPYPTTGYIPNWDVHGASGTTTYNVLYIYDSFTDTALPIAMPASYYCNPKLGFVSGNDCVNPDGAGHFVNLDGDPSFAGAISQAINGLVINQLYKLIFSWGAVQRVPETGLTSDEFLEVSLGNLHVNTTNFFPGPLSDPSKSLPTQGFSGWTTSSYYFTWDGTGSNVLTFLAHGNPGGLPPSVNLDGISLTAVPEPSTWALLIVGGFGLAGMATLRRQTVVGD